MRESALQVQARFPLAYANLHCEGPCESPLLYLEPLARIPCLRRVGTCTIS